MDHHMFTMNITRMVETERMLDSDKQNSFKFNGK